jgi:hypothetical protein
MTTAKKCARPACNCIAPEGKKYCSMVCEDSKAFTELTCHCGHPECTQPTK